MLKAEFISLPCFFSESDSDREGFKYEWNMRSGSIPWIGPDVN